MIKPDQTPTYNLKVVVQETGLKPDTLRAWERRYGLPQPERTDGGHRLYSEYDIDLLKWLIARQEDGLSISRAVQLWRKLVEEGQNPLLVNDMSAGAPLASLPDQTPTAEAAAAGNALEELTQQWVSACLAYHETRAEQALNQAFALYSVETVCLEILQKGLAQIGMGWFENRVTVQQEHFASELTIRRLEALLAATPGPTRSGRILLACPPEEEHTFSLLLLNLFLRRQGWEVIYLGANIPLARFQTTVKRVKPDLVILAAQQLYTAASLLEMSRTLLAAQIPLAFGGLIFNQLPALQHRIPGRFLGPSLAEVTNWVEALFSAAEPFSLPDKPPENKPAYQAGLAHYLAQQGALEAYVWRHLGQSQISPTHLATANMHMARNIIAALRLGDLNLLDMTIIWTKDLLGNSTLPETLLRDYLRVYYLAATENLGRPGQPIVDWLATMIDQFADV